MEMRKRIKAFQYSSYVQFSGHFTENVRKSVRLDRLSTDSSPYACSWCPSQSRLLAVVVESGTLYFTGVNHDNSQATNSRSFKIHNNAAMDVCWVSSAEVATASADKSICIFDVNHQTKKENF